MVGEEVSPGENGTRVLHVEVNLVSVLLQGRQQIGFFLEFLLVRPMVIENHDARRMIRQLGQFVRPWRDVDEEKQRILDERTRHTVAMSPGDEFTFARPRLPCSPGGSETIGTGSMVDADSPHQRRLTDREPRGAN